MKIENLPTEHIVKLPDSHKDDRGYIQPLCDLNMKSASLIYSKPNTWRANHYHKKDWHYCYVVSGKIEYLHRPTGSKVEPKVIMVNQGEIIFTPPMIDHGMKFPEDTVFLTLSRNPRDQATYEADVVRVDFVSTEGLVSWSPEESKQ